MVFLLGKNCLRLSLTHLPASFFQFATMNLLETVEHHNISCGWELYLVHLVGTSASSQHITETNAKYSVSCGFERKIPSYNYGTLDMVEAALSTLSKCRCFCNRAVILTLKFKGLKMCPFCWRDLVIHYTREVSCVVSWNVSLCLQLYRSSVIPLLNTNCITKILKQVFGS